MGFGTGPFGASALGTAAATLPSEDRSSLSSSKKIDAQTRTYVENDEGGFEYMDDVTQRALLLLLRRLGPKPAFVTAQSAEERRQAIRAALSPLTAGKSPAAEILSIAIVPFAGGMHETISIRNIATNTIQTVEP